MIWEEIWDDLMRSFDATPPGVAALRMLLATVFGALIGFEREANAQSAGLRTHILISLAACLFALIAFEIVASEEFGAAADSADPIRLISAITSGVAFLAAGSIIVTGGRVHGLTTGAGMWLAGAIGLCCGVGRIGLAAMAVTFALVVLWGLRPLKRAFGHDETDQR